MKSLQFLEERVLMNDLGESYTVRKYTDLSDGKIYFCRVPGKHFVDITEGLTKIKAESWEEVVELVGKP